MTVPVQIAWDFFHGQVVVWCACLRAGARRAVLLPRLDTIFAPREEAPQGRVPYDELDWRIVSPTEEDWLRYRRLVEKEAGRAGVRHHVQRVEDIARWVGGRQVVVPRYHLWLYRDAEVRPALDRLYEASDPGERSGLWRWLLAWTGPERTTRTTT